MNYPSLSLTHQRVISLSWCCMGILALMESCPVAYSSNNRNHYQGHHTIGSRVMMNGNRRHNVLSSSSSIRTFMPSIVRGGAVVEINDGDDVEETDDDDDEGMEQVDAIDDESEDEEEEVTKVPAVSGPPVKLIIKTGLGSQLIDQTLELMASRTRDVASLKLSCMRQMRGRPPVELQTIRQGMIELDDHITIDELMDDEDEDDEEENGAEDEDQTLILTLDMTPPVDPKFGTELGLLSKPKTTEELVDAYAANAASLMNVGRQLFGNENTKLSRGQDENEEEETSKTPFSPIESSQNLWMRRQALSIKNDLLSKMSDDALKLLDETGEEEESSDALLASSIRRNRRGGAKMNVKRAIQRNLNIDWGTTIRNFFLFLFFGFFGARDVMSRTLMYIGAPMCFIIQARPVKILIKQIFYGVGTPPGILLSLLPAPQQKIMDLDFASTMEELYGSSPKSINDSTEEESELNFEEDDYDDDYDEYI